MRILVTANHLDAAGGLERTQLTNCRGLARHGNRLDLVFVHGGAFEKDWEAITATMSRISTTLPRRGHPLRSSLDLVAALRRARRLEPDVVYVYRYWDPPSRSPWPTAVGQPSSTISASPRPSRSPAGSAPS